MLSVLVVSDGSGGTADRVVRSALAQFRDAEVTLFRRGQVRTAAQVREVVEEAARKGAILVHTLVSDELRRLMLSEARRQGVDALDLLGPVLDRLATHLRLTPQQKPGLMEQLAEARSREIEAVEFAFRHDDGQKADELDRAEVVLVGVSRSMKTPTTLYLAYRGWFAANVPIVPELPLPEKLLALPPERVFCLVVSPGRLLELRRVRARLDLIPEETYASLDKVAQELRHCQRLCLERKWQSVDVTGKSVEEVSREIITLLGSRSPA